MATVGAMIFLILLMNAKLAYSFTLVYDVEYFIVYNLLAFLATNGIMCQFALYFTILFAYKDHRRLSKKSTDPCFSKSLKACFYPVIALLLFTFQYYEY